MAGEDLNSIISVFLDDQATGPLQEIPVAVAATVSEINAKLAGLAAENPFAKLLTDAERAQLSLEQVSAAVRGAAASYELLAQAERAIGTATGLRPSQVGGQLGISSEQLAVQRSNLELSARESELSQTNSARQQRNATSLIQSGASNQQVSEFSGLDVEQVKALRTEILALGSSFGEAAVGAGRLTASEATLAQAQEILGGGTTAEQRAAAASYLAQARVARAAETGDIEKTVAALRQQVATEEQLAKAREQAAVAGGGGGGFFGGFGKGLIGGNGDFGDSANIGRQLGDIARYIYVYEAFYKITEAVKESIKLTKEYENGLVSLQVALQSVGQQGAVTAQQLVSVGAPGGFTPGESLQAGARGIQAFRDESSVSAADAQRVALSSVDAAQQAVALSGEKMVETQGQVIAATRAYELGADGQTRTLDAATNANINFGASIKDVLEGLAQVAGIGKESGFSIEQLANAIGLITSTTGLSGSSAAGDLKRILGGAGAPAFQKALEQVGVDTNQSTEKELESLGEKYRSLTEAQQANVLATLGGRRSAEALIPLLESVGSFQDANTRSLQNGGAAAERYAKLQETLAGIMRQLKGATEALLVDIGQSGIGAAFGLALQSLVPLVQTLDEFVKVFNLIPAPIREATFAIIEFTLAAKVLQGLELGALVGRVFGGARVAGTAEELGVLGAAGRAGGGAAGAGLFSRIVAAPGVAAEAEGGALASTTAGLASISAALPAALAGLGAVGLLLTANDGIKFHGALAKAQQALDNLPSVVASGPGGAESLQSAVSSLQAQRAALNSGSTLGAGVALLTGQDPIGKQRELTSQINLLQDQISLLNAVAAAHPETQVPQSVDQLDAKVKALEASGSTAAQIVNFLAGTINSMGLAAQEAAKHVGQLTVGPSGGLGFAVSASQLTPSSVTAAAAYSDLNATLPDAPPGSPGAQVTTNIRLSAAQKKAIQDQESAYLTQQNKTDPNATISEADLTAFGQIYASHLDKALGTDATKKAVAAYVASLRALAGKNSTAGLDLGTLNEAQTLLLDQAQKELSAATARGAGSGEIQADRQRILGVLAKARSVYQASGKDIPADLQQALAVAGKEAFDAFSAHITELANVAKVQAGNDSAAKTRIDQEVKALLTAANKIDPTLLPTGIENLGQGKILIADAVLQSGREDAAAVALYVSAEKQAAEIVALATAQLNAALARIPDNGTENVESRAYQAYAAAQARAAALTGAAKPPTRGLNDPSAQPGIDTSGGSGSSSGPTDTAAQIAAARNAANVFPGAPVELAAAAVRTAAADLAAQKGGTVAFYNALKQLRQAQYDYAQAVLEAQHVARELSIDLTNPLAVAQEALRTAQAKLSSDRAKHAPTDVLNNDRLAVEQAANAAEATKFSQNLDQVKTNYDLERITRTQYINYLDAQRDHLLAIHKRTYQQQQELNQIDTLLKEAAKQLQGQFNLGDIKLPTPFEVRRQIAGGASAAVGSTQYVNVNISGADTAKVTAVLTTLIGPSAFGRATVTTSKL